MKFSKNAQGALAIAKKYAVDFNSKNVGTEHLLIGLLSCEDKTLVDTFKKLDVEPTVLVEVVTSILSIDNINKNNHKLSPVVNYTPRVIKIIEFAKGIAQKLSKNNVEVIHLFLSLLYENDGVAVSILLEYGLDFITVKNVMKREFGEEIDSNPDFGDIPEDIQQYFNNISNLIEKNKLDIPINRNADYNKFFITLSKKHNTNIIVTGDPGVGKRCVVYELARRIYKNQAPENLCNKVILEIKLKSLIGGTKYRGDFESRMDSIHNFLKNNTNVIVVIPDITLIARIEGTSNVEEYFSELFDLDDINFIGIADSDNYRKYLEDNSYIVSNFEVINIKPTNKEETFDIVSNNIYRYEKFHEIKYRLDVIKYAIDLSTRYLTDHSQPTASINLLDECGSYLRIKNKNIDQKAIELEIRRDDLEDRKIELVKEHKFDAAIKIKNEQEIIESKISDKPKKTSRKKNTVDLQLLKEIVFHKTGIPVSEINGALPNLEDAINNIKSSYVSQVQAVDTIFEHFKRVKTGLQDPSKPLGSFLFLGPTGVGKTYLCELISEQFFHHRNAFLKVDMSEFMDKHSVSKLIGSPPGYVGYKDKCLLGDFVKNNPYSLILFDEIEKAHPDVVNIFLQILDKGDLTDSTGRKINFKNTIIVFTSNIGADLFETKTIGFTQSAMSTTDLENKLQGFFKPEFLNRLDEIITFDHLENEDILNLVYILIKKFVAKLKKIHKIKFIITDEATDYIANHGYSRKYGARFLKRYIQKHIECMVATLIIANKEKLQKVTCKLENNELIIE